jgi:catechol 2,3-dioxygenase-like lactoylglutathione lyase family enzyme
MKGSEMKLRNLVPVLDVQDVEESIHFYCETLGFSVQDKVTWGGRTEWALLRSGQVQLMLCASQPADEDVTTPSDGVFFVYLENVDALHVYLGGRGLDRSLQALDLDPIGRDFYLRDPDGYVLWFSHKPLRPDEKQAELNGAARVPA